MKNRNLRKKRKKSVEKFINSSLEQIKSNFINNERLLYCNLSIQGKKAEFITKIVFLSVLLGMSLFFIFSLLNLQISLLMLNEFLILSFSFLFLILFFSLFFILKSKIFKTYNFLCFSNVKLYISHSYGRLYSFNSIFLRDIKAISFKYKKRSSMNNFRGNVMIYTNEPKLSPIIVKNMKNLLNLQNVIESIIYEYGHVKERLDESITKKNYHLPLTIELSKKRNNKILKKLKRLKITNYISIPSIFILILLFLFFYFQGDLIFNLDSNTNLLIFQILTLFGFIFTTIYGPLFIVSLLVTIKKINERILPENSRLIIYENNLTVKHNGKSTSVDFNEHVFLKPIIVGKPTRQILSWTNFIDGFQIINPINDEKVLTFGPIDYFTELYEFIYCHVLKWKKSNSFLLDRKTLEELVTNDLGKRFNEIENLNEKKEYYIERTDYNLINQPIPYYILQNFQNYLDPDEEIIYYHVPKISFKKNVALIISIMIYSIIMFYLMFYLPTIDFSYFFVIIIIIIISVFPLIFCCFSSMSLTGKILLKKSIFAFSNKKILIKYNKVYCFVPYKNIKFIEKKESRNRASVNIFLKNEMLNSPFLLKDIISIPLMKKENEIFKKINYIIKKYKES